MPSSVEVILIPTIMILLGFLLKKFSILKDNDKQLLTKIVLNIGLPAMIFINLYNADITFDMLELPVIALILSLLLLIIAYAYCKMRGYSKRTTWTIMLASSMMNTGFIGFPVTMGVFGNDGFLHAIFFDLSTTILFIIYGIVLAREFGGSRDEIIKQAVKFIPLWAVICAIIFNIFNISLPYVANSILNYLGDVTIPLIMFSLGLSLDFKYIGQSLQNSLFVSVIKLVISPLLALLLLSLMKITGIAFNVAILEAGMSTAMNALVLSLTYDLDSKLMSSIIFTNVVLSLFTLTYIITCLT